MFIENGIAKIDNVQYKERSWPGCILEQPRTLFQDLPIEWDERGFSLNLPENGEVRLVSREPIFTRLFPAGFLALWSLAAGESGFVGDSELNMGQVHKLGNFGRVWGI